MSDQSILDYLNEDCWSLVLSYVPLRDIMRTECTSRQWQRMVLTYLSHTRIGVKVYFDLLDDNRELTGIVQNVRWAMLPEIWTQKLGSSVVAGYCNNRTYKVIGENCPNLEGVTFIDLPEELLLNNQYKNFQKLQKLRFIHCYNFIDLPEELLLNNQYKNFQKLQKLRFIHCYNIRYAMESKVSQMNATSGFSISPAADIAVASAPQIPAKVTSGLGLRQQVSAPSYFASLSENAAPPFLLPGKQAHPRIIIDTIMSDKEAVEMVAAAGVPHGLRKYISDFVVEKKVTENFNLSERQFLTSLVCEVTDYAAQRDFSAFKLAVLITLYLDTHKYFKWSYWLPPREVWVYFTENLIRHTIEDSPDGQEVFEPEESYDILTHFHTSYLSNLPLVHLATFGATRLRLSWAFQQK